MPVSAEVRFGEGAHADLPCLPHRFRIRFRGLRGPGYDPEFLTGLNILKCRIRPVWNPKETARYRVLRSMSRVHPNVNVIC